MPSAAPTARLEASIITELHAMLKRAAEIQDRTLPDFVVSAVQEAAQRAIEQAGGGRPPVAGRLGALCPGHPVPAGPIAGLRVCLRASPQVATTYLEGTSQDLTIDPGVV
jgi:hypothetical protein